MTTEKTNDEKAQECVAAFKPLADAAYLQLREIHNAAHHVDRTCRDFRDLLSADPDAADATLSILFRRRALDGKASVAEVLANSDALVEFVEELDALARERAEMLDITI